MNARRIGDLARSRRFAAWATAACAVVVLVTVSVGGAAASRDSSRVAGVSAGPVAPTASCTGTWCVVSWTVTAADGPVRLDRVVLPDLGFGAEDPDRRLLGVGAAGDALELPSGDDEVDAGRTNAIVAIQRVVEGGTSITVTATVAVSRGCPDRGRAAVPAVFTVSSGAVVDQRRPAAVALPCPA